MKRVCAWCRKELGTKPGPDNLITHGICDYCLEAVSADPDHGGQTFLERIPAPILLVNPEGVVITANKFACKRLNKKLPQIRNALGGDVIECAWARLPGGCGRTEHCEGCVIRQSVMKTHKTGRSIIRHRAYHTIFTRKGTKKMWLLISTQKIKDVVFLRIDDMGEMEEGEEFPPSAKACMTRRTPAKPRRRARPDVDTHGKHQG